MITILLIAITIISLFVAWTLYEDLESCSNKPMNWIFIVLNVCSACFFIAILFRDLLL